MSIIFKIKRLLLLGIFSIHLNGFTQSLSNPESIEFDQVNNRYLISNHTPGRIIARAMDGTLSTFKSGISPNPYGLEIMGDVVYACCSGTIKGYNLATAEEVFSINTGATFLNGITHDMDGNLFATDFTGKRIYRINPESNTSNIMASNLVQSPNGIIADLPNSRLIFVNWGSNAPIKAISLVDSTVTVIANTTLGNIDGIARDNNGNYYVSYWSQQSIAKFTSNFTGQPEVLLSGLSNPADICYNPNTNQIAIPNSSNNTISFLDLGQIVILPCFELPLELDVENIRFNGDVFGADADSVLIIPIQNNSDLDFAYPLAYLTVLNDLPSGLSLTPNSALFEVFASSWNAGESSDIRFNFHVNEAIPENFTLNYRLRIANIDVSGIDTCFFEEDFEINLNPQTSVGFKTLEIPSFTVFPNPAKDFVRITSSNTDGVGTIDLLDIHGRLVGQHSLFGTQVEIPISGLSHGVYFIRVISDKGQYRGMSRLVH